MLNRRGFLTGLIAAPAVIRIAPLMRVTPVPLMGWEEIAIKLTPELTSEIGSGVLSSGQISREVIRMFRETNVFVR